MLYRSNFLMLLLLQLLNPSSILLLLDLFYVFSFQYTALETTLPNNCFSISLLSDWEPSLAFKINTERKIKSNLMKYKICTIMNSLLIIMLLILNLYSLNKIVSLNKKNKVTYDEKGDFNQQSEYMTKKEVALFLNISLDKLINILVEEEKD